MARLDLVIHRETQAGVRREPDVVITLAVALEAAASIEQEALQLGREAAAHDYATRRTTESLRASNSYGTSGPSG